MMTMITIKSVLMMTIAVQPLVQNLGAWDGFLESKPFCSKVGFTNSKARPTSIQCQKSRFKLSQKKFKFSILERALIGLIASKWRLRVNCWKNYLPVYSLTHALSSRDDFANVASEQYVPFSKVRFFLFSPVFHIRLCTSQQRHLFA